MWAYPSLCWEKVGTAEGNKMGNPRKTREPARDLNPNSECSLPRLLGDRLLNHRSTRRPWKQSSEEQKCAELVIFFNEWKWKSLSHVWLFVTPWTVAYQALLAMGSLQARILEWVAMPFSRGSSQSRDEPRSPALQGDSLPSEPPGKPSYKSVPSLNMNSLDSRDPDGSQSRAQTRKSSWKKWTASLPCIFPKYSADCQFTQAQGRPTRPRPRK